MAQSDAGVATILPYAINQSKPPEGKRARGTGDTSTDAGTREHTDAQKHRHTDTPPRETQPPPIVPRGPAHSKLRGRCGKRAFTSYEFQQPPSAMYSDDYRVEAEATVFSSSVRARSRCRKYVRVHSGRPSTHPEVSVGRTDVGLTHSATGCRNVSYCVMVCHSMAAMCTES